MMKSVILYNCKTTNKLRFLKILKKASSEFSIMLVGCGNEDLSSMSYCD